MAFARDVYTAGAAQTDYTITFPYQEEEDVKVFNNGSLLAVTTDYTFFNATTIRLVVASTAGDTVVNQRSTSQSARDVDFTPGTLTEADLDNAALQAFYMAQEAIDIANIKLGKNTAEIWDATSLKILNVLDPTLAQDAATKNYVDLLTLGSFPSPLAIGSGGTGSATASAARTALGVQEHVMTTQGDMVRAGASGAPERVAIGASGTILESDGTDAAWIAKESVTTPFPMPKSHIDGLTLSNNGVTPDEQLDIAAGEARDGGNAANMILSALTKDLAASWAVGTGNGGLDGTESSAGTMDASTWYHIWLIKRPDTGVVDVLASESATGPTMPTNYTLKRRIGAVLTDSSADIRLFLQYGDEFMWDTPESSDFNTTYTNHDTTEDTHACIVPLGVRVRANLVIGLEDTTPAGSVRAHVYPTDITVTGVLTSSMSHGATHVSGEMSINTTFVLADTAQGVHFKVTTQAADIKVRIGTLGWIDPRGKTQ